MDGGSVTFVLDDGETERGVITVAALLMGAWRRSLSRQAPIELTPEHWFVRR